jgi:ribosomal-protein-alanine N-acetyltransferase
MKKASVNLTAAQISDIPELTQLEQTVFAPADGIITKQQFRYHIQKGKNLLLVAKQIDSPHKIIGYILVLIYTKSARIYSLAVNPEHQGQRVGRAMLQASLTQILAKEISNVHLEFRKENTSAQKLYSSLGFTITGTRRNYYGKQQDAVLMTWKQKIARAEKRTKRYSH